MTEPFLEDPRAATSLATPETQQRVLDLEAKLAAWREVLDYENWMGLTEQRDEAYRASENYEEDVRVLAELRQYAEEA